MATNTLTREVNRMLDDLRYVGFAVVNVGQRWRVTNPEGGDPVFIPAGHMNSKKDLTGLTSALAGIGFTPELVEAKREEERQARLAADRQQNERALAAAQAKAADSMNNPFSPPNPAAVGAVLNAKAAIKGVARRPGVRPLDGEIVTDTVELDLALAKDLIRMNTFYQDSTLGKERNRPVNRERVIAYAKTMVAGGWLATNQGIGVDVNGILVDGQKRALALILACEGIVEAGDRIITLPDVKPRPNTTVPMLITWNLPSEAKYAVDMGEFRSVAAQVGMSGETNANNLASAVKLVILYDRGEDWQRWSKLAVSAAEIIDKLGEEPELREAIKGAALAGTLMVASAANAGYYLCLRAHPGGPMNDFMHGLKTGENLAKGDPRLALRNWLQKRKDGTRASQRRADNAVHLAVFIKAWNEFAQGIRRQDMKFLDEERFPTPFTPKADKPPRAKK